MASWQPAAGDSRKEHEAKRWATPRFWLAAASLSSFLAVSYGVASVAASRGGSETAYAATSSSSSTLKSPKTIVSSWSMSPLPEGDGGAVSSSTQMSPVTEDSSLVMAPH